MIHTNKKEDFEHYGLIKYLLQSLEDWSCTKGRDLKLLRITKSLKTIEQINGIYKKIYKSKWLELWYVIIEMDVEFEQIFI